MEFFKYLATGGSTVDEFAKNVYIKTNLSAQLSETIKTIKKKLLKISESSCDSEQLDNRNITITDITISCIDNFLIIIESVFLHGLKEKLSFSKVLSPVRLGDRTNRNSSKKNKNIVNYPDFWPVVLILNHNQVNSSLESLNNINTDIGKCKAWIRLALNDGLLTSYLRALMNDTSLLHGFYRPSAFLRDKDHMENFTHLIDSLENVRFSLNYDYKSLNFWNEKSLILSGYNFNKPNDYLLSDKNALEPVLPAIDALNMINEDNEINVNNNIEEIKNKSNEENLIEESDSKKSNYSGNLIQIKTGWSTSPPEVVETFFDDFSLSNSDVTISSPKKVKSIPTSKKKISSYNNKLDSYSYDSLLQSYSSDANLCSTPEIREIYMINNDSSKKSLSSNKLKRKISAEKTKKTESNFEIIPQSLVLDNKNKSTQEFLSKFLKIQSEIGLDRQDYKCNMCARPIGMVYGKSRLCKYDGLHYCLECNKDEKSIIPAKIIHNWDFNKYVISKENKEKLDLIENEPLIDLKFANPLLYKFNSVMKECLQLRTQLFYLHGYLFTCQESVALDLRKQVWPSEHLFEHIHLYSLNDLQQAQTGQLLLNLKKSINSAKKHVSTCVLCSQKGFICEICRSPHIIYPFDIETTFRCENCKAVFHLNCIITKNQLNDSNTQSTKQKPCPRCLRIKCREKISKIRLN